MYAHRQIYDHAAATIAVPPELQQQSIEVIFIALNMQNPPAPSQQPSDSSSQFGMGTRIWQRFAAFSDQPLEIAERTVLPRAADILP